jgi:hypothetical protein
MSTSCVVMVMALGALWIVDPTTGVVATRVLAIAGEIPIIKSPMIAIAIRLILIISPVLKYLPIRAYRLTSLDLGKE